jgi:hypothetical protein
MANMDAVGQNTQDSFGNYRIANNMIPVSLATTGNAVVALPFLKGGSGGTTEYIIRRITVANLSNSAGGAAPNAATANISIGTTNDGANLVANAQVLTNLTGATGYADLTLNATSNSSVYTANALFVNVNTSVANAQVFIAVYGDIVTF